MAEYIMMLCPVLLRTSRASLRIPSGKKLILVAVAIISIVA